MIIPTNVRVNGKLMTRNSVAVRVNGVIRTTDLDTINWSDSRPAELIQGMNDGGKPLGKAPGPYACAAGLGVYADAAPAFIASILAGAPLALASGNLSDAIFQMIITLTEDVRTRIITWRDCTITERGERTVGNDGSAIIMPYTIQPVVIEEDGLGLYNRIPAL